MPPSATATLLMQFDTGSGYGSPVQGGQVVPAGTIVKLTASSYAGWGAPAGDYEIPAGSYPEGWPCPTGWTAYPDGSYHYLASAITGYAPPTFPLPDSAGVASGLFGKWGLQLTVNGGGSPGLVDASCAIEIVGQTGVHDLGNREGAQFGGPARRWAGPVQANWRLLDAAIGGGIGGGVSLGAGTPAKVKATAGTQGALSVAAAFDHRHEVEVASPVPIGTVLMDGIQTKLSLSDHVHTLPFSVLLAVCAVATGNLDFNGHKLVNVGAPTTSGDVVTYDYANALVNFTSVAAALGAATGNIDINGWQIINSGAPTTSTSLTTKAYVDAVAHGFDYKQEVRGASLGNQSLTGPLTEDGLTYADGDRYLAKDQTSAPTNGIWIVNTTGAWTRAPDAAVSSDVTPGMFCFVISGTTNQKTGWAMFTPGPIVLGTTALSFTQIFGPGTLVAGAGLTQSGNVFNVVANADGSIVVNADDIQVGVLATDAQHGARGGGTQHAAVTTSVNGFMIAADKAKLDGIADGAAVNYIEVIPPLVIAGADITPIISISPATSSDPGSMSAAHFTLVNNATPAATANTLGERDANADIAFRRLALTDELSFIAGGALSIGQKSSTTGNGVAARIVAQDAKSGAYTGGDLQIGGGNGGDASHRNGNTTVQVGPVLFGGQSAHFIVDAHGTPVLDVTLDDATKESRISAGGLPLGFQEASRFRGAVALVPQALTYASTIALDASLGSRLNLILTNSTTFTTPTNFDDGATLEIFIEYGVPGMGPYTVTWSGGHFVFPLLPTAIGSALLGSSQYDVDYYEFKKRGPNWICVIHNMHHLP